MDWIVYITVISLSKGIEINETILFLYNIFIPHLFLKIM